MFKKIPQEVKEEITRLYDNGNGLPLKKIARQTGVSYASVYRMTKVRQRVNPETERSYKSGTEYENYLAKQRVNPETGQLFESLTELKGYQARQRVNPETGKPFVSYTEYNKYFARQRVDPETGKPYKSLTEYEKHLARQRISKNRKLSELVKRRLKELGRNQLWLAEQLEVSKQAVSFYVQGRSMPRGEKLERLMQILNINHKINLKSLDDLVEDNL